MKIQIRDNIICPVTVASTADVMIVIDVFRRSSFSASASTLSTLSSTLRIFCHVAHALPCFLESLQILISQFIRPCFLSSCSATSLERERERERENQPATILEEKYYCSALQSKHAAIIPNCTSNDGHPPPLFLPINQQSSKMGHPLRRQNRLGLCQSNHRHRWCHRFSRGGTMSHEGQRIRCAARHYRILRFLSRCYQKSRR